MIPNPTDPAFDSTPGGSGIGNCSHTVPGLINGSLIMNRGLVFLKGFAWDVFPLCLLRIHSAQTIVKLFWASLYTG